MRLLAALIFFTRLPFWRIAEVPGSCFKRVVEYWPFVGWLTGGAMAGTLWLGAQCLPLPVAVILSLLVRLFMTGALHEDGLADFFDGFGGGTSKERILAIMKDSHIGTYGVLALVSYCALLWASLSSLPVSLACVALPAGDAWSKACSAQLINLLPYARKEEEAKAKVIYDRMDTAHFLLTLMAGGLPMVLFLDSMYWWAAWTPATVCLLLVLLMKKRIQGYTGDCCGAAFLLCELSFYLTINLIHTSL